MIGTKIGKLNIKNRAMQQMQNDLERKHLSVYAYEYYENAWHPIVFRTLYKGGNQDETFFVRSKIIA